MVFQFVGSFMRTDGFSLGSKSNKRCGGRVLSLRIVHGGVVIS